MLSNIRPPYGAGVLRGFPTGVTTSTLGAIWPLGQSRLAVPVRWVAAMRRSYGRRHRDGAVAQSGTVFWGKLPNRT